MAAALGGAESRLPPTWSPRGFLQIQLRRASISLQRSREASTATRGSGSQSEGQNCHFRVPPTALLQGSIPSLQIALFFLWLTPRRTIKLILNPNLRIQVSSFCCSNTENMSTPNFSTAQNQFLSAFLGFLWMSGGCLGVVSGLFQGVFWAGSFRGCLMVFVCVCGGGGGGGWGGVGGSTIAGTSYCAE